MIRSTRHATRHAILPTTFRHGTTIWQTLFTCYFRLILQLGKAAALRRMSCSKRVLIMCPIDGGMEVTELGEYGADQNVQLPRLTSRSWDQVTVPDRGKAACWNVLRQGQTTLDSSSSCVSICRAICTSRKSSIFLLNCWTHTLCWILRATDPAPCVCCHYSLLLEDQNPPSQHASVQLQHADLSTAASAICQDDGLVDRGKSMLAICSDM